MRQQKIPAPSKLSLLSLEPEIQCLLIETCFWMIELVWSPLVQKALVVTLGAAVLSQIYALLSVKFWGLKMCECKKYDKYHVYLFQTLSLGCSSAPQVLWTQWRGHRICSVLGGPEVNTSFFFDSKMKRLANLWSVWERLRNKRSVPAKTTVSRSLQSFVFCTWWVCFCEKVLDSPTMFNSLTKLTNFVR